MISNYFIVAWRNLKKNKIYSAINILGLAAGMAVALIIALWVYHEYSYDRFLPDYERAYQVRRNFNSNGEILNFNTTSLKLADALRRDIPEIEYVAESDWMAPHGLMVGDKKLYLDGGLSGSDFLKIFRFPFLEGNAETAMKDPYSIVLTASSAMALFGDEHAINKTVRFDNEHDLKVTGILKDLPSNSSFQFKFLVPFSYYEQTQDWVKEARGSDFTWNSFQQFVKLKPGVSLEQVAAKIKNIEKGENSVNAKNSDVVLQPMERWHLYSKYENGKDSAGFIEYVRIFSIIGVLVLLIACINFINLTTARSEKRAREVGIRKAIGSQRKSLILQFLVESILVTAIAAFFSVLFVQLALPAFNTLTRAYLSIPFANANFWLILIACVLITGLLAGSRPAFYLSSFNPVKVLKGTMQTTKSATFSRKALVVLQFSCSVALIISTVVVYRQIQFAKDRPSGLEVDRLMMTDMNSDLQKNFSALRNDLLQSRIVQDVTTSSSPATGIYWHTDLDNFPGKIAGETVEMGAIVVADNYFNTLGMEMASGRDFSASAANDSLNVIFNEAAIKRLRIKNPLNQTITFHGKQLTIIGVVKDALMDSPFSRADPTMFLHQEGVNGNMIYRLAPGVPLKDALAKLTGVFNKHNPAFPYTYRFVDEEYNRKFNQEVLVGKLSGLFSLLAIFISCLGLFGLAAYVAEQRTKEIGVRKVLGASVAQVWVLLSKDFIMLVLISCVIASPIALYFLQNWLQKYDYRISIGPGVFIIAAITALVITLLTISFQAIRSALANPVKSLRSE
jgi:putative ABC transport system permease protein